MTQREAVTSPAADRLALLSICGFWLLYFAIGTLRSAIVFRDADGMLFERIAIALVGAAGAALIYLVLRLVPTTQWRRSIAIAALLALPASCAFATFDWFAIDHRFPDRHERRRRDQPRAAVSPAIEASSEDAFAARAVSVTDTHRAERHGGAIRSIADQAFNAYFFFAAWATLYLALRYSAEIGDLERRTARLQSAAQAAELRALRYQVNPHFLFNTLNSLSTQVLSGRRDDAERMIANLATFFRTSLTDDATHDVPLAEEIRLQRLYLDIEAVRFPQRLLVDLAVPDELGAARVPGLILQPLVENAVKYGVARSKRPVTIRIAAAVAGDLLELTVEDDGDGAPAAQPGTGIGLGNVSDRLAAQYGDRASCRWGARPDGGFAVHLSLPLARHD